MLRRILPLLLCLAAACSPAVTPTPAPTLTLFPPTETPLPVTPTATETDLPAPQDLATSAPTLSAEPTGTQLADPIAAEMVGLAQRRLGQELDLPTVRIRLVEIAPMTWDDTRLGCLSVTGTPSPGPIDGYRLVLSAGDNQYIFHSDFDRLIPCDEADEALPEQTPAESTPESTPDPSP